MLTDGHAAQGGPPGHVASAALFFGACYCCRDMHARASALVLACVIASTAGCGGARGPSTPAANGVRAYVAALKRDDPRDAYELLAEATRRTLSYDQFAATWKATTAERAWQVRVLEASLQGNPDVGERAAVRFRDGARVQLEREGTGWRLESELAGAARARRPRDAIRILADAVTGRDLGGVLGILSQRRREAIGRQLEGFVAGIGARVHDAIDEYGDDRAELRWDDSGIRYRIVLRKEHGEWRVDDIYMRPAPRDDEIGSDPETVAPDDL